MLGEANFSDHGANRLGASALMQGLADGYFIIPYTIGNYLANAKPAKLPADVPAAKEAVANVEAITKKLLNANGTRTVDSYHRELGKIVWDYCGMARNEAGLKKALTLIPALREDFWKNVRVLGTNEEFNQSLEKAGRVADFFELAELMCLTRSIATNLAVAISAKSIRPPKAKLSVTTRIILMSPLGNTRALVALPHSTKSRSPLITSSLLNGATNETHTSRLETKKLPG